MVGGQPGYGQGFARSGYESDAPEEWRGLVGNWAPFLGNQGGVLYDLSGYENQGTLTNMSLATAWTVDAHGVALSFDGVDDYVNLARQPLGTGNPAYTITAWVLTGDKARSPGNDIIFLGAEGTSGAILPTIQSSNLIHSWWANDLSVSYSPANNTWAFVACTYDGTTRVTFVEGVQVASDIPSTTGRSLTTTVSRIGKRNSGAGFNGKIDDVRIYNRALSAAEILAIYRDTYAKHRLRRRKAWAVTTQVFTMAAASGSYALTGSTAALLSGRKLGVDGGTYLVTGSNVLLPQTYVLSAGVGSYLLTGSDVVLFWSGQGNRVLTAEGGSYVLSGSAAGLRVSRILTAGPGSYGLSGSNVSLRVGRLLSAAPGTYDLLPSNVLLQKGFALQAGSGVYLVAGSAASLSATRKLLAGLGGYVVSGSPAVLLWSEEGGPEPELIGFYIPTYRRRRR